MSPFSFRLLARLPLSRRIRPRKAVAIATLVVLAGALAALVVWHTAPVTVRLAVDGEVRTIETRADTVQDVLDAARIVLAPEDGVTPGPDAPLSDGQTITVRRAAAVTVETGSQVRRVRTQQTHPLDILQEQGLAVGPHDVLRVDGIEYTVQDLTGQEWPRAPYSIDVVPSAALHIVDDGQARLLYTTQSDVGRALDAAGIALYVGDEVVPGFSAPVEDGMTVTINRSAPVTLVADGRVLQTRSRGPLVGDALALAGLAPVGQDYVTPPVETPLEPGMRIALVRVDETLALETRPIPFHTVYRLDGTLAAGEQREMQPGADGVRTQSVRVRYEDGVEVSSVVVDEWVTAPPQPRVIRFGPADD